MDGSSTLEFKTILREWKQFQRHKLKFKMSNKYPCNLNAHLNDAGTITMHNSTLTFITEPEEPHLLVCHDSGLQFSIPLTDLNGYNTEARIIKLLVNSERNVEYIRLEFPSEAVHELALAHLDDFTRDRRVEWERLRSEGNKKNTEDKAQDTAVAGSSLITEVPGGRELSDIYLRHPANESSNEDKNAELPLDKRK